MPEKTLSDYENAAMSDSTSRSSFKNNVSGTGGPKSSSGRFKKKLPLVILIGLLGLGVGLIFVSQSLMPFAIINRFREEFNTLGISSTLRADNLLDYQLEFAGGFFSLSEAQRESFSENEITPVDFTLNSSRSTALIFKDNGKNVPVVSKNVLEKSSESAILSALKSVNGNLENLSSPISVEEALKTPNFKTPYTTASRTYRGGNSGWYDTLENLTEMRLSISRSRYANWTSYVLNAGERDAFKELASAKHAVDSGISDYGTYSEIAEDGSVTTSGTNGVVDSSSLTAAKTAEEVRSVLNSKIMNAAKLTATVGCAGVEIFSALQTIISVQQSLQYLNVATGYFEAVNKVQAGYGNESPVNDYNRRLTTPDPETGKTAVGSGGLYAKLTKTKMNTEAESLKVTNFESLGKSLGSLTGDLAFTAKAFETCSYVKMGISGINFTSAILSFVPILGQGVSAIHIVAKTVGKLALGVAVGEIVSFIVPKILASVVKNVIDDAATDWLGEDLSNAMNSGAHKLLAGNFQTGGGSGASAETFAAFNRSKETVLAEAADYEREKRSPFDLTSEYTFLGSLAYSFVPIATSVSLSGVLKTLGDVFSTSSISLLPTASAVSEAESSKSIGACENLASIGAVGDENCNMYFVTDESTIKDSPLAIIKKVYELNPNNFKVYHENGEVEVNPDSNLGKYIKYCGQRNSNFGTPDANIANQIVKKPDSLVANAPLVGDVSLLISAAAEVENMPWISGSACVASAENSLWEENKYYQRFSEDQRLFESMGIVKKSAQTAMLEDYYRENPLDNSRAGIIARFSGLAESEVLAYLDLIDGLVYIANYAPETRLAFFETPETSPAELSFTEKTSETEENRLYLIYDKFLQQVRKRNLSVAQS